MAIVALIAALLVAAAFNLAGSRYWRESYVTWGAPVAEEVAKTVAAVTIGAPVISVHLLFGLAEVIWDLGAGGRILASFTSVILHTVLGLATFQVWYWTGHWWLGLGAASLLHLGWNVALSTKSA